MSAFQRHNLPNCIEGFEHINRYYDSTNNVYMAKILPGEFYVSRNNELITTVLGSCISACVRDPVVCIGGMNHFMLPYDRRAQHRDEAQDLTVASRYGDFAMEMLINEVIKQGGKRKNLEIKLFGGGKVINNIHSIDVGQQNIAFAREYLSFEGLKVSAESIGDIFPRKVNYFSGTGKVKMKKLRTINNNTITRREDNYYKTIIKKTEYKQQN